MCSCGCGGSHKHDELVPMVGVITDPTTAGLSDSQQAMAYETPKKD